MPSEKDLPPKLGKLSLINAVNISTDSKRLPLDIKLLIAEVNDIISRSIRRPRHFKILNFKKLVWIIGLTASLVVITVLAVIYFRNNYAEQKPTEPTKGKSETPLIVKNNIVLTKKEMSDIDGNIYKTVTIGTQVWMTENLKVTRYSNGDPIPNVTDSLQWINLQTGAYCSYKNLISNSKIYGYLYNWFAVSDKRGLCPDGWHVPIHAEFDILSDYLGNWKIAGGKLKETGYDHWEIPNIGANNTTGFSALPGGCRKKYGFFGIGTNGYFLFNKSAWIMGLDYDSPERSGDLYDHLDGYSVRCIKH